MASDLDLSAVVEQKPGAPIEHEVELFMAVLRLGVRVRSAAPSSASVAATPKPVMPRYGRIARQVALNGG